MSLGFYASSQAAGAPPSTPPSLWQSRTNGGVSSNVTSTAITLPTDGFTRPPSGALMITYTVWTRANPTDPTMEMSGWTPMWSDYDYNGSISVKMAIFYKISSGSEATTVNLTTTLAGQMSWICEAWTGHDGAIAPGGTAGLQTGGTGSYSSNSVSAPANSVVTTFLAGRGPSNGNVAQVWGGGATDAGIPDSGRVVYAELGTQTVTSAATVQHTVSVTNSQGGPTTGLASLVIEPA